eukprot:scaffold227428_cov36-Prasinocladus_malaysianus.AAC.1
MGCSASTLLSADGRFHAPKLGPQVQVAANNGPNDATCLDVDDEAAHHAQQMAGRIIPFVPRRVVRTFLHTTRTRTTGAQQPGQLRQLSSDGASSGIIGSML